MPLSTNELPIPEDVDAKNATMPQANKELFVKRIVAEGMKFLSNRFRKVGKLEMEKDQDKYTGRIWPGH